MSSDSDDELSVPAALRTTPSEAAPAAVAQPASGRTAASSHLQLLQLMEGIAKPILAREAAEKEMAVLDKDREVEMKRHLHELKEHRRELEARAQEEEDEEDGLEAPSVLQVALESERWFEPGPAEIVPDAGDPWLGVNGAAASVAGRDGAAARARIVGRLDAARSARDLFFAACCDPDADVAATALRCLKDLVLGKSVAGAEGGSSERKTHVALSFEQCGPPSKRPRLAEAAKIVSPTARDVLLALRCVGFRPPATAGGARDDRSLAQSLPLTGKSLHGRGADAGPPPPPPPLDGIVRALLVLLDAGWAFGDDGEGMWELVRALLCCTVDPGVRGSGLLFSLGAVLTRLWGLLPDGPEAVVWARARSLLDQTVAPTLSTLLKVLRALPRVPSARTVGRAAALLALGDSGQAPVTKDAAERVMRCCSWFFGGILQAVQSKRPEVYTRTLAVVSLLQWALWGSRAETAAWRTRTLKELREKLNGTSSALGRDPLLATSYPDVSAALSVLTTMMVLLARWGEGRTLASRHDDDDDDDEDDNPEDGDKRGSGTANIDDEPEVRSLQPADDEGGGDRELGDEPAP